VPILEHWLPLNAPISFEDFTRSVLELLVEQGYIGFDLEPLDSVQTRQNEYQTVPFGVYIHIRF